MLWIRDAIERGIGWGRLGEVGGGGGKGWSEGIGTWGKLYLSRRVASSSPRRRSPSVCVATEQIQLRACFPC